MTCYRIPAQRHFDDATFLLKDNRLANADHLFGVSAECALKCILAGLRIISNDTGRPPRPYGCHINKLWKVYHSALSGRSHAKYLVAIANNPFSTWDVDHRYEDAQPAHTDVTRHEAAARAALGIMQLAMIDGNIQ